MSLMTDQLAPSRVSSDEFRAVLRHQASTVTVVTVPGTPPAGFTATSFTSVSLEPMLVSFCLRHASSTMPAVTRAEYVAVHLLSYRQQALARRFATGGIDRFAAPTSWYPGPHDVPILSGTIAWLVARVVARPVAGDHVLVLAQPLVCRHGVDDLPLLYHNGRFTVLEPVQPQMVQPIPQ